MKSLKSRLITIFTVLILSLTVIFAFVSINIISKNLTKDTHNDLKNMAQVHAKYIESKRNEELRYVDALAQNAIIQNEKVSLEKKVAFCEAEAKRTGYIRFSYADKNGNAIHLDKDKEKVNISDREYFQKAIKGEMSASDVIISKTTGEPITIFAAPVYKNGQVIGALYGEKEGTVLSKVSKEIKYGKTGNAYILNNEGTTVGNKNIDLVIKQDNIIKNAEKDEELKDFANVIKNKMLKRKVGSGEYNYNGKDRVIGFAPVEGSPWIIAIGIDKSESLAEVNFLRNIFIIMSLIIIAIGALITYFVSGTIANPVADVTERLEELANYDFTYDENTKAIKHLNREDEIGQMTKALRLMRDNIVDLIKNTSNVAEKVVASSQELTATSNQTAIASEEVAKTIEEIAKGATDQASNTESSTQEVEEMGNLLRQNKVHTEELNNAVKNITKSKEEGFTILNELVEKTNNSNEAANNVYEIILSNNESAEKIDSASTMIQSISEQTNLLALNAAIEAARAGEQGKGFAVVAEEIRKLAEQSNSFTEEIKKVIEELKTKSQNAVNTMKEVGGIVQSQSESVKQTEEKFDMISSSIEITESAIEKLNESAEKLDENKDNIIDLMQNLSAIAEENAAGTEQASASIEEQSASIEEIASASDGLTKIVEELDELIKKFII